ncbi:hypothetical protein ACWF94_06655 [Streptomyces sp. NPDC055078]
MRGFPYQVFTNMSPPIARRFPSWLSAPADAVEAFTAANAAAWEEIARADAAPWKAAMAHHADIPQYVPYGLFEPVQQHLDATLV